MPSVTLTGDWRRLNAVMRRFGMTADILNDAIEEEAERIRAEIISQIESGVTPPPNRDSTIRQKGHDNTLIEYGNFGSEEGIIMDSYSTSDKKRYFIIKGNSARYHSRTGLNYEELAELMETGGGSTPARPVFTMTYDRLSKSIERNLIHRLDV